MKLIVNGNNIDITLENERTVGEVLKSFEEEAAKNDATTVSIVLNGKAVPAQDFEKAIQEPISEDTVLELSVISKNDIKQAFTLSAQNFAQLSQQLSQVSILLQSGKDKDANQIIADLATEIDRFCHTATLSALFPDTYQKLLIDGKEIGTFFEDFAPVLKDFEEALKGKDTVTVGDLAEYEIGPRLNSIAQALNKEIA